VLFVFFIIIIIIIHHHHHQLYTSSSGRPVGCMSTLLKQHLNTHKHNYCGQLGVTLGSSSIGYTFMRK
jgi:hypothetical protein